MTSQVRRPRRKFTAEKRTITRERARSPLPSRAKTARRIVELTTSAIPRPPSRMPKALPCSAAGAQFLVALIIDAQNVSVMLTPQNPWMMMETA
jgi:hypothetical protein